MIDKEHILSELQFKTSRSGGAGGQHVNKVESKVTLIWDIGASIYLTDGERALLIKRLQHRLTKEGVLMLEASDDRSQMRNKALVIERFFNLLEVALRPEKKRIATKIPKSKVLERLDRKKKQGQKKASRRKNQRWD